MSNRLEDFISNNREDFDSELPSGKVWQRVEGSFSGKKKTKIIHLPFFKWGIAAASVLIIGSIIYLQLNKKETVEPVAAKTETDINKLAPDYAPQMNQFAKMIDMKQEELKVLAKEQPQLYHKFTKDIIQLDSSYNALKSQLSVTPNREMLLEAMIQNLQLQLNVLNQQLNIIQQIKQSKKYSHEKIYSAI
jgi:hypothetical protein